MNVTEKEELILKDVLCDCNSHQVLLLNEYRSDESIQSNIFLIIDNGKGMILDPGGPKAYKHLLADVGGLVGYEGLKYISISHQDPDILAGLGAWLMTTKAEVLAPKVWEKFIPHLGLSSLANKRLKLIPDMGGVVQLENSYINMLPAHFLHSVGNMHLYDQSSKILFSGDLAISVGAEYIYVQDFDAHIPFIEKFHKRYMGNQAIVKAWVAMVRKLDVEIIAPQHGAIYKGKEMIEKLLNWLETQECGIDIMAKNGFPINDEVFI